MCIMFENVSNVICNKADTSKWLVKHNHQPLGSFYHPSPSTKPHSKNNTVGLLQNIHGYINGTKMTFHSKNHQP